MLLGIGLGLATLLAGRVQPVEAKHVESHTSLHPTGAWWQNRHSRYEGATGGCAAPANPEPTDSSLPVGYSHHSYSDNDCGKSDVYQTRVVFDLSEFQRYALVDGDPVYAQLTYQEDFLDFSSIPNFVLVLQGYDDSLDLRNDACLSTLSNITLDLTAVWNVPAPDLRVQSMTLTGKNGAHVCATGSVHVATTIHSESDVGAATYDVLIKVDGQPRETVIAGPIGSYADRPETFLTTLDVSAGDHTLQVLVDPDHQLNRIEDSTDVACMSINCAQGATPTPTPKPANLQVSVVEVQDADGHSRCVAGSGNNVHQVIRNTGDYDVSDVITVQVSIDGKPVRSVTVVGLAANTQKDSYVTGVTLSAGTHSVKVTADPDHTGSRAVTSNNSASIRINCVKS